MKKIRGLIIGLIVLAVVGVGIVKGKEYYNDRYVGETYYAIVPESQSLDLETIYDDSGDEMGIGRDYNLVGYNKEGKSKDLEFTLRTENPDDLFQKGAYVAVERSNQIVLGEKVIDKSEIPENILKLIEENK